MCHGRSWFTAQSQQAKADEMKDKRSETVEALLRESNEQAQKTKAAPAPAPAKEAAPAK